MRMECFEINILPPKIGIFNPKHSDRFLIVKNSLFLANSLYQIFIIITNFLGF